MRSILFFYAAILFLSVGSDRAAGAWSDKTAGLPWLKHYSPQDLGTVRYQWFVDQDKLGRLFVGGAGLMVHDGQSWRTYAIGTSYVVRTLQFGADGRTWIGALNEFGYLTEPSIGNFQYHSLLGHLPEKDRLVGHIWGCGLVGSHVYFIGKERLYGWDGAALRVWNFPGESRLFPLKLGEETWFQHRETGLYRITETGPKLEVDRSQLLDMGILGLTRDSGGLLVIGSTGFYRPGAPVKMESSEELNRYITENRLSAYLHLPDGTHLVGTINGGLAMVAPDGRILRIIDAADHPAAQVILSIAADSNGQIWCSTVDGIIRFEPKGLVTLFNSRNGLSGGVMGQDARSEYFYACNQAGVFKLKPGGMKAAVFERQPQFKEVYMSLQIHGEGLLLGRHGGLDFYDGHSLRSIYGVLAKGIYKIHPSAFPHGSYLLSEGDALTRLAPQPDGSFEHHTLTALPDPPMALAEDAAGRIWLGTTGLGAFIVDPANPGLQPAVDPVTDKAFAGYVSVSHNDSGLLVFADQKVLRADTEGTGLKTLLPLPGVMPNVALAAPAGEETVLAFTRKGASSASTWGQGLGLLGRGRTGSPEWHELDVPALESIGIVQLMKFTEENDRPILWLGGTEGMLRLDYEAMPRMQAPTTPFIRLDTAQSGEAVNPGVLEFPFRNHRLSFRIFTGDPTRGADWLLQTRLEQNGGAWSVPSDRRAYEFSSLSEGAYRFEVRAVNATGLASEPAVFTFRILPPWYRSRGAYAGYALALALGIWGTIRFRERRILGQKAALERLVQERTAELVKANAAKDDFLAGVSHEIRNPMNGVIGIAESLRTTGLDPESRRKFGLLRQCAGHLSSLLEDILDISKIQAGITELETKPFDLHELVGTVAAMAAGDSEKFHIPVETAISPGVPRHLLGDPRRIRQILLNFVSNALKFSGRGKVELTVWCQPAGSIDRVEVIFAVSDDGPGISAEEQRRLFNRFERGAAARQGRVPGTGLGLALCKGFAEKMGGRLWLESEPGRGSCFYFSAPFALAPEPVEPAPVTDAPAPMGAPRLALVVDDQEYNRIVLADLLATLGFSARAAADGAEALALAAREDFELVFLDYDLPGMCGLAVARGIRALPGRSAHAHILATTAFSTPEKRQECLDAGMNAFLGKPVTLERLRKAVADLSPADPPPPPVPEEPPPPLDGLANLRLLASKKQVRFDDELALYLSEMQVELEQLDEAMGLEQAAEAAHHAHRLCGRFSFIYERKLEQLLRELEECVARGHWPEAGRVREDITPALAAMRLRLASASPVAPPA